MAQSMWDANEAQKDKYNTRKNKFSDFSVGTKVQIICFCQDFNFFNGTEKGVVIENQGEYLGITVRFNKRFTFNFAPDDLIVLKNPAKTASKIKVCKYCQSLL